VASCGNKGGAVFQLILPTVLPNEFHRGQSSTAAKI
jgi:hypothetical protein